MSTNVLLNISTVNNFTVGEPGSYRTTQFSNMEGIQADGWDTDKEHVFNT